MPHRSILDYYLNNAQAHGGDTAALVKRDGHYQAVTWGQMAADSKRIAAALIALGVEAGERVCILSRTRIEWVVQDMAILWAGAVTVPIYPSSLADECQFILNDSDSRVVFAEDAGQVAKLRAERHQLPRVLKVVQLDGALAENDGWAISMAELMAAAEPDDSVLAARHASLNADSVLTITYTSGTTGRPKGVVTTHDNMLYEAEAVAQIGLLSTSDVHLLFLPLAHVFARIAEIAWLAQRFVVAFAESMESLRHNLVEVKPTLMAAVPRVFEKFYAAVVHKGQAGSPVARLLFNRALALSERHGEAQMQGKRLPLRVRAEFLALKATVLRKVGTGLKAALGGRMRLLVSGAAPLAPKIAWFFRDAGVLVLEGFGLTETSAATCVNRIDNNRIGSVGWPLPGTEAKLAEDGELMFRGRGVMRGYWNNEAATQAAFRDGWFLTGDIATLDGDGCVRIVDRKKDLIVTAGGKNVAPQNIENLVKTAPLISQVVVHGDRRKFLSALITLDPDAVQAFAQGHHLPAMPFAELTQTDAVQQEVDQAIQHFNGQLPSYETIKKYKILAHDFSTESGELTPSLKVKRRVINQRYQAIFDGFYADDGP